MRTSALFLVFTLTGALLLPPIARAAALDPQTATTNVRRTAQVRDRARIAQSTDRLNLPAVVPDLKGTPERAWSGILAKSHLRLGRIIYVESDGPGGTILRQQPHAGSRVRPDEAVDVYVSKERTRTNAGSRARDRSDTTDRRVPDHDGPRRPPPPPGVKVPNVVGEFVDAARLVLQRYRLRLDDVKWVESSQPRGVVLDQGPRPGVVVPVNDDVDVVASQGPPSVPPPPPPPRGVRVPNVVGELVDPARLVLERYRLGLDDVKWVESPRPRGMVLQQYPQPDQLVRVGSAVDVVVSQGPPRIVPATVPAVVGEYLEAAVVRVRGATLQPGTVRTVFAKAAKGVVVGQSPGAGATVDRNSLVHLVVSAGEQLVTVPDLVNGRFEAVSTALEKARLQIGTVTREEAQLDAGVILGQDPVPGSQVRQNTPVNIRVSLGNPWTEVPDLLKTDLATAARLLDDRKLRLGVVERKEARSSAGSVLEQSPASGSRVRRGTRVGVVVSIEPPLQTVPDLVRRTEDEARAAVANTRLQIGVVSRHEASIAVGLILTQEPAAGSQVPADTRVNLRVSLGAPQTIVPALVSLNLENATGLLKNANLQLGTVQRGEPRLRSDIVLAQSPQPGGQVPRGTTINLVVSTEEVLVVVPDLVQRSEQDARATIATLQLQVGDVQQRETRTTAGLVLSQSMAPGARVPRGARIGLVISQAPRPSSAGPPPPPPPPPSPPPPPLQTPPPVDIPPPRAGGSSPPAPVDPWPPIPQLPWSWIASMGFAALYGIQRWRARGKSAPESPKAEPPPVPQIYLLPRPDQGWQDIAFEDADETALALELRFTEDPGAQRIVEAFDVVDTEQRHEYSDTDTERSVRHRPRRAS